MKCQKSIRAVKLDAASFETFENDRDLLQIFLKFIVIQGRGTSILLVNFAIRKLEAYATLRRCTR